MEVNNQTPARTSRKSYRLVIGIIIGVIVALFMSLLSLVFGFWLGANSDQFNDVSSLPVRDTNYSLPEDLDYTEVEQVYDILRDSYDGPLSEEELLVGLKKGLVEAVGDPYSFYYTEAEAQELLAEITGEVVGIGILLETRPDNHHQIVGVIDNSPAKAAGLLANDVIYQVDNVNVVNLPARNVINLITGEEGTEVVIKVERSSDNDTVRKLAFTIERQVINIPSVTHEINQDNIGILQINQFHAPSSDNNYLEAATVMQMQQAVDAFEDSQIKALVLDLRNNPGGELTVTYLVARFWLEADQDVVHFVDYQGHQGIEEAEYEAEFPNLDNLVEASLADIPLVILVNGASASAAEILAGALQDHQKGVVVGEPTVGKTTVQTLNSPNSNNELIKFTTYHWSTPLGTDLSEGLQPDIVIADDPETEVDEQLEKALQVLNN